MSVAAICAVTLVAACTSDGTTSDVSTIPTSEVTPVATATIVGADPTDVAGGDATPPPHPGRGAWAIDAATGDVAVLGADAGSALQLRDSFFPAFTPDGSAVWLSRANWTDARRYALDGTLTDSIEGAWAVLESVDARSRVYYLRSGGDRTTNLVAERDGTTHHFEGRHAAPAFSPDGQMLAFYSIDDSNVASLVVLDLESGETRIVGTEIDPCGCDLTPRPQWSPSGKYIAYYDYAGNDSDAGFGAATFVVEVESGESRLAGAGASPAYAPGWLTGGSFGERLILVDYSIRLVALYDPATGFPSSIFAGSETERLAHVRRVGQLYVEVSLVIPDGDDASLATLLIEGSTGDFVARWDFDGSAAMTPDGPALAVSPHARDTGGCDGVLVIHAALADPRCLDGVDDVIWSPDGSALATATNEASRRVIGTWNPVTATRVLTNIDSGVLIGWNPQGTHLFVSDGTGL